MKFTNLLRTNMNKVIELNVNDVIYLVESIKFEKPIIKCFVSNIEVGYSDGFNDMCKVYLNEICGDYHFEFMTDSPPFVSNTSKLCSVSIFETFDEARNHTYDLIINLVLKLEKRKNETFQLSHNFNSKVTEDEYFNT